MGGQIVNKVIIKIISLFAISASNLSFGMMIVRDKIARPYSCLNRRSDEWNQARKKVFGQLPYEMRREQAIAKVLGVPELVQNIQKHAETSDEICWSLRTGQQKKIKKDQSCAMRATCQAMNKAVRMPRLEKAKPFLIGEKCLLDVEDELIKAGQSHKLAAKDFVIRYELADESNFGPDGELLLDRLPNEFIQRYLQDHISLKERDFRKEIQQHNKAVKRACYLAIKCEDTECLGRMVDSNIDIPKGTADKYNFYRDLVVYAIDSSCNKSFEYLIQKNPCDLNNHCEWLVGPIAKDVKAASFTGEEQEKYLAFCKKNGCDTLEEAKEKLRKQEAISSGQHEAGRNAWCVLF